MRSGPLGPQNFVFGGCISNTMFYFVHLFAILHDFGQKLKLVMNVALRKQSKILVHMKYNSLTNTNVTAQKEIKCL